MFQERNPYISRNLYRIFIFHHFCSVRKVDGAKYAVLVSVASSNRMHVQQSITDIIDSGIQSVSQSTRHQRDPPVCAAATLRLAATLQHTV